MKKFHTQNAQQVQTVPPKYSKQPRKVNTSARFIQSFIRHTDKAYTYRQRA